MHIDVKKTIWERIYIPKDKKDSIISQIELGKSLESIVDNLYNDPDISFEDIYESAEMMIPEKNDGYSTIEVFDNVNNLIYSNSKRN